MASITVDVDVDLDQFDLEEIIDEVIQMGFSVSASPETLKKLPSWCREKIEKLVTRERPILEDMEDILECLRHGRHDQAELIAERVLHPKFSSIEHCKLKLAALSKQHGDSHLP